LPFFDGSPNPFRLWFYSVSDRECGDALGWHNRQFDGQPHPHPDAHADPDAGPDASTYTYTYTDANPHAYTYTNSNDASAFRSTALGARDLGDRRKP
jgi:hypothetical protein